MTEDLNVIMAIHIHSLQQVLTIQISYDIKLFCFSVDIHDLRSHGGVCSSGQSVLPGGQSASHSRGHLAETLQLVHYQVG